jgi:Ca2+-binding RTX toxin-like protein
VTSRLVVTALGALLLLAAPAGAADVNPDQAFFGSMSYLDNDSANNAVTVSAVNDKLHFVDSVVMTTTGACTQPADKHIVDCPAAGETGLQVNLGGGNDNFNASSVNGLTYWVVGEAGGDSIATADLVDFLTGGPGDDFLYAYDGNDTLTDGQVVFLGSTSPGSGTDEMYGMEGNDTFDMDVYATGGAGNDKHDGGNGIDTADYADRTAAITADLTAQTGGQAGETDKLIAIESVIGGSAGDTLRGAGTNDRLNGGPGDDVLDGRGGADTLIGGTGVDTVSYAAVAGPVTVSLDGTAGDGAANENDNVGADVERLEGTAAGDGLTGGAIANTIWGLAGADTIEGGDGGDTLDGGAGADAISAGPGNDTVLARDGEKDSIACGTGEDSVTADASDDVFGDCETVSRPPVEAAPTATPTPAPGAAPTPTPTPTPPVVHGRIAVGTSKAKVDAKGRVTIKLTCTLAPCAGRLTLARKGKKLGSAPFTLAKGASKRVRVKVGRKLLRRVKSVKADATASGAGLTTAIRRVTLRR